MAKPYKSVLTRPQLQRLAALFSRRVAEWLDARLDIYFSALQERFFEKMEQAPNDEARHDFAHAARELPKRQVAVGQVFRANLLKAVETFFLHYEAYLEEFIHAFTSSAGDQGALELVNNEKLEEDLVILRVSHQATTRLQPAYKEVTSYLAAVVQPKDLPPNGTPLSPQVIANCLRMALSGWEGTPASRFLFYQTLAEELMPKLSLLFEPTIAALRDLGLEPVESRLKMKRTAVRQRALPLPPHPRTPENIVPSGAAQDEATIFSVLGLMRQMDEQDRKDLKMVGSLAGAASKPGPALRPDTLMEVVEGLKGERFREVENLQEMRSIQRRWKETLVVKLKEKMAQEHAKLHQLDQQILDIVTMLFDFVLDDSLIPDSMKVLLVRLQIPVLQIAIRDKTFLTDNRHPARLLINNLSRAAVRWAGRTDCTEDNVYAMIQDTVCIVLEGDAGDPDLYREANCRFEAFLAQEERGARVAEERLSQVARGKEQLALARRRVNTLLDRLVSEELPDVVREILEDVWRDVLTLVLLREGEESDAWRDALGVATRLARGSWNLESREESVSIEKEAPDLLGELRRGFASIAYDSKKAAQLLERLEGCYAAVSRGDGPCLSEPITEEDEEKPLGDTAYPSEPDRWDRLVASLKEGDWVRWEATEGEEYRGKLVWRSEIADLLLFVDMRGRKLAEHTSQRLAELFRQGHASVLEQIDQPFMERALHYLHQLLSRRVARHSPRILPA